MNETIIVVRTELSIPERINFENDLVAKWVMS